MNIGRNLVNLGVERLDEILGSYRSSFPPWGTYIYDTHTHTHTGLVCVCVQGQGFLFFIEKEKIYIYIYREYKCDVAGPLVDLFS